MSEDDIRFGACYSNGAYGAKWAVVQVTRENEDGSITFKVVAGANRRRTASMSRAEFARWAQYEVVLRENEWVRRED